MLARCAHVAARVPLHPVCIVPVPAVWCLLSASHGVRYTAAEYRERLYKEISRKRKEARHKRSHRHHHHSK